MGTFIEKFLGKEEGSVVIMFPDYVVINDGVSSAAVDEISTVANQDNVWVFHDHDVPTGSSAAADILRKNLAFAKKYGCHYVQAKGVGYQYLLDEVVKPGQIVVGAGSHGSIYGSIGALGIDVSIPELARVVETGRYSLVVPKTVNLTVRGELADSVSVMDAVNTFLAKEHDVKDKVIEIYAPTLDAQQKSVFCSMITLTGAFTAVVVDEENLEAIELDLSTVKPMVMLPCDTREEQGSAKIVEKAEVDLSDLDGGQISGYTGGTIEDLRKAAEMTKDKKLSHGFRLSVCPATSNDFIQALNEGIITELINYGAQIQAVGDRSVVVQGAGAMGRDEKLITTGLYTFAGAMGLDSAKVYSASVESVMEASFATEAKQI